MIRLVAASSLNGKLASTSSDSLASRKNLGITSAADKDYVEHLMAKADAVIVGGRSVRADGKCWELRNGLRQPHWFVLTNRGIGNSLAFWQQTGLRRTLVSQESLRIFSDDVENITFGKTNPAIYLAETLKIRGYEEILLFGGGEVNQLFFLQGLVDKINLTLSPLIIGDIDAPSLTSLPLNAPVHLRLESFQMESDHVFLEYNVLKNRTLI